MRKEKKPGVYRGSVEIAAGLLADLAESIAVRFGAVEDINKGLRGQVSSLGGRVAEAEKRLSNIEKVLQGHIDTIARLVEITNGIPNYVDRLEWLETAFDQMRVHVHSYNSARGPVATGGPGRVRPGHKNVETIQ